MVLLAQMFIKDSNCAGEWRLQRPPELLVVPISIRSPDGTPVNHGSVKNVVIAALKLPSSRIPAMCWQPSLPQPILLRFYRSCSFGWFLSPFQAMLSTNWFGDGGRIPFGNLFEVATRLPLIILLAMKKPEENKRPVFRLAPRKLTGKELIPVLATTATEAEAKPSKPVPTSTQARGLRNCSAEQPRRRRPPGRGTQVRAGNRASMLSHPLTMIVTALHHRRSILPGADVSVAGEEQSSSCR